MQFGPLAKWKPGVKLSSTPLDKAELSFLRLLKEE